MRTEQTQYFYVDREPPKYPGRYKYKMGGTGRPVMRWWNGKTWQLNRRKAVPFKQGGDDMWAGSPTLHPEVERMLTMKLSYNEKQPVKLELDRRDGDRRSSERRASV